MAASFARIRLGEKIEGLCASLIFPTVLGLGVYWGITEIEAGTPSAIAVAIPIVVSYIAIALAERVLYWEPDWLHSKGDLPVDIGHLLVSGLLTPQLLEVPIRIGAIAAAAWLAGETGSLLWPTDWSLLAQLALALVVGEFFMYWVHRLAHELDWLWRFHALHHSAPRLYFLNAARFHPVDLAISNFAPMIPLLLLGADDRVIALFGLVSAIHGLFQHANLVTRLGPLNWIFSMAELHRWHHSPIIEESNTNFGQNLIVWDIVFGTRYLPADREAPREIGLAGLPGFPMDYWGQLASPFRWRSITQGPARAPIAASEPDPSGPLPGSLDHG
jgi:sterol desaturase/sphingolipid hydroxylase (fatty acid hydroxylase superfamily)